MPEYKNQDHFLRVRGVEKLVKISEYAKDPNNPFSITDNRFKQMA